MAAVGTCFNVSHPNFFVFTLSFFMTLCMVLSHDAPSYNSFAADSHVHENSVDSSKYRPRYLLYEVNHGEGFNLRRDVYMRVANLVKALNEHEPWVLVLPPWGRIYHWKSDVDQERIPWRTFFDVNSLAVHIPVIELEEFLEIEGPVIDETHYLQSYAEGWNGGWVEKMDVRPCIKKNMYRKVEDEELWTGYFWGYGELMAARKFQCVSAQAHAGFLTDYLINQTTARTVLYDRAETLLHTSFGGSMFWQARRSMVFNSELTEIGDKFRKEILNSDDVSDKTERGKWWEMKKSHGDALGGNYLSVHLRRADFLWGHTNDVPSLKGAAEQITKLLTKLSLSTVFIATDARDSEFDELKGRLSNYTVTRYRPDDHVFTRFKDGGVAIIDQWIAAHARYFIGTHVSTFSFRIQEEREIMGFLPETTFNCLCPDDNLECEQPAKWKIVY